MDKIALGVSFGFTGGAIFGTILGLLTKDFAVWLAIGVGFGIVLGSSVGLFLKNTGK